MENPYTEVVTATDWQKIGGASKAKTSAAAKAKRRKKIDLKHVVTLCKAMLNS